MAKGTAAERILNLAASHGIISARDVREAGVHTQALTRLVRAGRLARVAPGQYRLSNSESDFTEHHGLVLATAAAPRGVICLLSALQFHEIGTQLPREVWLALPRGTRAPRVDYPPLRVVRFSGEAFDTGVEHHVLEGRSVPIYSIAKTLADCFKFRNRIGMDAVLEALSQAWEDRRVALAEVDRYARICRVRNVMRPYLEAIAA